MFATEIEKFRIWSGEMRAKTKNLNRQNVVGDSYWIQNIYIYIFETKSMASTSFATHKPNEMDNCLVL